MYESLLPAKTNYISEGITFTLPSCESVAGDVSHLSKHLTQSSRSLITLLILKERRFSQQRNTLPWWICQVVLILGLLLNWTAALTVHLPTRWREGALLMHFFFLLTRRQWLTDSRLLRKLFCQMTGTDGSLCPPWFRGRLQIHFELLSLEQVWRGTATLSTITSVSFRPYNSLPWFRTGMFC